MFESIVTATTVETKVSIELTQEQVEVLVLEAVKVMRPDLASYNLRCSIGCGCYVGCEFACDVVGQKTETK